MPINTLAGKTVPIDVDLDLQIPNDVKQKVFCELCNLEFDVAGYGGLKTHMYKGQFGCGILKIVGPKMQDFCPKIDMLKGNRCILRIWGAPARQKLGMILENEVLQKLKLEKKVFSKNGLLN